MNAPPELEPQGIFEARYLAFLETVTHLRSRLHRYCSRMTGSVFDGEDVVQDALFQAYRKLDTLADDRPLAPWLFRIAHNRCIDLLRRRGVREHAEAAVEAPASVLPDDPPGPALGRAVEHLVLTLPPKERACVLLKDVFDYSLEEIADLVDSTVGGVKAALSRGRAKLAPAHRDGERPHRAHRRLPALSVDSPGCSRGDPRSCPSWLAAAPGPGVSRVAPQPSYSNEITTFILQNGASIAMTRLLPVWGSLMAIQAATAQSPTVPPLSAYLMPRDAELALVRSAAPATISDRATIKVLTTSGYQVARDGQSGFVCIVLRGWAAPTYTPAEIRGLVYDPTVRAPICFNPAAARTVMPYYELRSKLGMAGNTPDQIAAAVQAAYAKGELPARDEVSFAYMWSADQQLGPGVGHWHPHMMVFAPYHDNSMLGGNPFGSPLPFVTDDAGTPFAVVVIPVDDRLAIKAQQQ